MSQLMSAYATDNLMNRAQLAMVPTPAPMGRFHRPLPFVDFVDEVEHQLSRVGLQIVDEEHLVGHEGQRHFGLLETAPLEGELIRAKDWKFLVALRGSHDQSVDKALAGGRHTGVCSNLCIWGDLGVFHTRHTTNILERLAGMIYELVSKVPEMAHLEERRVERLKGFEMKPRWGDAALVEIMRRGGLTAAQLGRAVAEWDEPSHEEFTEHGHSAWRLEQAVTEAVKPTGSSGNANMFTVSNRTQVASRFINEVVGF